jgi:glycosyltransferase involved in cell wall biosynthesis
MEKKRVVIFFAELSDYILNVFNSWTERSDVELYIFRTAVNQNDAPFEFSLDSNSIYFFNREDFNSGNLPLKVEDIDPQMIICAGWGDRAYLKTVSMFSKKIPTVLVFDNQWHGTLKQYVATMLSRFTIVNLFDYVWVPGDSQVTYAQKLGFSNSRIFKGFYVANRANFDVNTINPNKTFSRRFIFLGRYIERKGIKDLWQAFVEIQNENPNDWELWCIGTGSLENEKMKHPQIKHIGFVQPKDLRNYINEGGVFVLPSYFEAWGVVVHEFAYSGFPMLVSDAVGAATQFVEDGVNGYLFKSKSKDELKEKMKNIISLSEDKLREMGDNSYNMASLVTEESWVNTANKMLKVDSIDGN